MWFWVWALLVVGTLVGAFFLGRDLWRAGVRVLREVSAAGRALGSGAERVSLAVAEAEGNRVDTSATMFDDVVVLRERVQARRLAREGRRAVRRERHRSTWDVWARTDWLERRRAEKAAKSEKAEAAVKTAPVRGGLGHTRLP